MGFVIGMIRYGMGFHATQIPIENVVIIAKFLLIAEILYVSNLAWTKLSILMMYYRILHFPFFKRWAYIICTFIIVWLILVILLFIFTCVPIEKQWNPMFQATVSAWSELELPIRHQRFSPIWLS